MASAATAQIKAVITAEDRASATLQKFGNTVQAQEGKAKKSFSGIAASASALVGTAVVFQQIKKFTVDAITAFADFESNLGLLQSVTESTNSQLQTMKDLAITLGNDLTLPGVSAADAALAMIELGKAGLGVNDVIGAAKGVLQGAKAGNIDFSKSALLVATSLQAFKLRGDKATKVADLFAAAANASAVEVEDVGLALQQTASSAHQLGVPLDATVALIAELGNQGIRGSDAGTSLKTMFQRLVPHTKKAKEAMKELGIDMFDVNGKFIGIRPAIDKLSKATKGLSQEQKQQALYAIFGSDAIRAANIITAEGTKGFDKMTKAVNREGAAADLAASRNRGIKGSLDALKSSFETIQLKVGEFLSKALKPLVDILSKNLSAVLIGVAVAFGALAIALIALNIPLLISVAAFLAIPVVLGLIATGLVILQQKFGFLTTIWTAIKNAATPVVEWFKVNLLPTLEKLWKIVGEQLKKAWDDLKTSFESMMTSLKPIMPQLKVLGIILAIVVLAPLVILIATIVTLIATFIAVGVVIARVIGWFSKLQAKFWEAMAKIEKAVEPIREAIIAPFRAAFNWILKTIDKVTEKLGSLSPGNITDKVVSWASGGLLGENATGTGFFGGGMSLVGEQGPEVVSMPRGSKVIPNNSLNKVSGQPAQINITVQAGAFVGSPQDARRFANEILTALKDVASMQGTNLEQLMKV